MATLTVSELEAYLAKLDLDAPTPQFPTADVLSKPLDLYRSHLADIIASLIECDPAVAYNSIVSSNNIENGDLAIILPKLSPGAKVDELAFNLTKKFPQQHPLFNLPHHEGAQLRFWLNPQTLPRFLLPYITDRHTTYGTDPSLGAQDASTSPNSPKKHLVLEFSSPPIAKDFEGKHLRSTILGLFISNLYEAMGWSVTKLNYLGDWGKPIGLLGVGWEKFGSEEEFEKDPVKHLQDVYHQINEPFLLEDAKRKHARDERIKHAREDGGETAEIEAQGLFAERNMFFKRLEDGDPDAVALFKRVRDVNIENYTKLYARLGISFSEYSGESQVSPETMSEVEELLKEKGVLEESNGAWMVDMKKHKGRPGAAIIRNREGSSTYELRDLAAVLERSRKFEFDKMIYVVAADHNVHFSRIFKILEALGLGELVGKLQHVNFSDVSKITEKLGHGHQPHEVLDQCQTAMLNVLKGDEERAALLGDSEEAAKVIGITALLAQELSAKRSSDHAFDISAMTTFKPGTGPDFQYWNAKLLSLLATTPAPTELSDEQFAGLAKEEHANLLRILAQYPDVTHAAYRTLEPSTITTYLVNVTDQLSIVLEEDGKDGGAGSEVTPAQAKLYEATRRVLENGMRLLGLTPTARQEQERADTPVAE